MHSTIDKKLVVPLYGTGIQRVNKFVAATQNPQEGMVFVTNYESLLMPSLFLRFQDWRPECIIFDECHRLKSYKAQRSKLADKLANPVSRAKPFTLILSGTPILNSPMDVFQQYKVLDGGQTFGSNFWAFQARYFRDRNAGMKGSSKYFPDWQIRTLEKDGVDALGEMTQKMFRIASRVEKKDCLDLPPEVSVIHKVGMSAAQARLYKEMKSDFITFFNSKACTASLAITKALRLMQITSGFVALENDGPTQDENPSIETALEETPKLAALKEKLEELCNDQGHKVLVWAVWSFNYEQIRTVCEELSLGYVEVHGGVSAAGKRAAVDKFKDDKDCRVFIGHPGSGGIGINLVNASHSIFYSRTFSLEHYLQARARNHRAGAKEQGHESITHYDLVCEGTIDELVVNRLASKLELSDKMLADLVEEL
jgi:SNF2 family DNA or RNA helicase